MSKILGLCNVSGCMNPSAFRPTLLLFAPSEAYVEGEKQEPIQAKIGMEVCDEHHNTIKATDLLTDDAYMQLCKACVNIGVMQPERSRTKLEWEEIKKLVLPS